MCERGTYWDLGLAQVFSWAPHSGAATCIYLQAHDRPVAFYSDKHTVFRVANQAAKSGHGMTQFGRANRTLQDRLVKALRLAGISDIKAANAFLPECVERYNSRFAKVPQRSDNLHRTLNFEADRLADILCLRDERYVGNQLALSYARHRIILEQTEISRGLVGKYVDTFEFPDGRLDIRWKGIALPYSSFDKDQRVTHAAITGNKRLGAVLEFIKAEQEKAQPKKHRAGKQGTRHTKTGRRPPGRRSKMEPYYARKRVEREARAANPGSDP